MDIINQLHLNNLGANQVSLILIISGILVCSCGYKVFRLALSFGAFAVGTLAAAEFIYNVSGNSLTLAVTMGVITGTVFGLLTFKIYNLRIFFAGAAFGCFLGGFLSANLRSNILLTAIPFSICAGVFALYFKKFERIIIIAVTSWSGGWGLILGTTYLMGTHTIDVGVKHLNRDIIFVKLSSYFSIEGAMMIVCWILSVITGFSVQYIFFYNKNEQKNHIKVKKASTKSSIKDILKKYEESEDGNAADIQESDFGDSSQCKETSHAESGKTYSDLYGDVIQDYINKSETHL